MPTITKNIPSGEFCKCKKIQDYFYFFLRYNRCKATSQEINQLTKRTINISCQLVFLSVFVLI